MNNNDKKNRLVFYNFFFFKKTNAKSISLVFVDSFQSTRLQIENLYYCYYYYLLFFVMFFFFRFVLFASQHIPVQKKKDIAVAWWARLECPMIGPKMHLVVPIAAVAI